MKPTSRSDIITGTLGPTLKWVQKTQYHHRKSANNSITYITKIQLCKTVALLNPDYNKKNRGVLYASITFVPAVFLFAISVSILSESTLDHHTSAVTDVYAQPYVETVKHRNLTIVLGNGLKTNAELTIPAVGEGPFPGVLLIPGAGPNDMNYTAGTSVKPFWQISQYLTERGFAVLRYDKRAIGDGGVILDRNVWGNMTYDDLKQDAEKALNVLLQQPEVDSKKLSLIGHSEGGEIATRVAIVYPDKVKNLVLMDARIQIPYDALYYGVVGLPLEYARQILDKNHNGSFSLQKASQDQTFQVIVGGNTSLILIQSLHYGTKPLKSGYGPNADRYININAEFKPILERRLQNAFEASKCERTELPCPIYLKSILGLKPTLSIIDNVSSSTGILILHGQNDSGSRVQQAYLLQQRLTELNHPDHILVTYPDLGHVLYPSSEWVTSFGPIPEYVLQDIFEWLSSPSRQK